GKTIILSSHLLADVQDVCDRVVIYYGGRIQAMGSLGELLTERDSVRITSPLLPAKVLERALEILRAEVGPEGIRVDSPTQNLENYFLGVVQRARAAEAKTSGATSGGRVAAYLQGDAPPEANAGARVLEQLVAAAPTAPSRESATPAASEVPSAPAADTARLDALTRGTPAPAPAPTPAPPTPTPGAPSAKDLAQADDRLSSLLGGDKK
ncbi:MAG: ABC transporter ATP-binding protein, partial [Verrucomicrobiales bacterium]|nr:ABC transporter ATP-binding protein [Verrucomicrobiales bacterium]